MLERRVSAPPETVWRLWTTVNSRRGTAFAVPKRLHDEEWTQRLVAGRANELENLERVVGG